jgi:Sperm-tail PG-rich repeat
MVPGPGSYDLRSKLGLESPHYSMAAKKDSGPLNHNPGPADYAVNDSLVRENSPGKSIPKAERGTSA